MVNAVFGPVFRYFDVLDSAGEAAFFDTLPKVRAWRANLATRPSVQQAAGSGYVAELHRFLLARGSELSRRIFGYVKVEPDAIKRMAAFDQNRTLIDDPHPNKSIRPRNRASQSRR